MKDVIVAGPLGYDNGPGGSGGAGRFNSCEVDEATFGFGNHFMFYDENVAGFEHEVVFRQRLEKFVCQRIAGFDFVSESDGNETDFGGRLLRFTLFVFFRHEFLHAAAR